MRGPLVDWIVGARKLDTPRAILFGLIAAIVAITLRLTLTMQTGGEQAIFAYPAIIFATLLIGVRGGIITALLCFVALWYYVIPDRGSFHIANARAAITLLVYALVGSALIAAIGAMRSALARLRTLTGYLAELVEERTADRNRLWDLSPELMTIVAANGCIAHVNPSFRALLPHAELTPFAATLVAEDRPAFAEAQAALDVGRMAASFDARIPGEDGAVRHIAWSMVRDSGLLYLIGRDFTAEHECQEQLRQSQKMEIIGQIAGGLAHDFGNVMSSINIANHLMLAQCGDSPRAVELIDMARQSATLGDALVRRLLALSQPGDSRTETVPLRTLLDDFMPLLRQSIGERRFELVIADDLPEVRVDASQFDLALLNLGINARDATSDGDVLTLRAERVDGHMVDIIIADGGRGMDAATLERAAEPFFTTKQAGHGTGLGLPMVRHFTQGAGGRFTLDSRPGEGTIARISLPIAGPAPS